ncbi:hypothetical protein LUZ63_020658 [Rhynchospora breviuscula]|uniref:Phosphoenolpyruvate-protein phosphotransferase n=1 Tax=Rhynchospora breviuscula TaxID=2022672 RepID=A0A9P9Z840_9POAL|nr:hypothetical protein LUZ63_020658 [Rhynchospora breviuscula]
MATDTLDQLVGTPVVPGLALGPVLRARTEVDPAAVAAYVAPESVDDALAAYDDAVAAVSGTFARRADAAAGEAKQVLTASAGLAKDKGLRSTVRKNLNAGGSLLDALEESVEFFAGLFAQQGGLMAERVTDLRDIHKRLLAHLVGEPEPGVPTPDVPSVLVAEDLAPSDTSGLDPELVVALVTEKGGSTSHTAIIARQLGIPCLVGVDGALGLASRTVVLVDGTTGVVEVGPDEAAARDRVEQDRLDREELARWSGPATTSDGGTGEAAGERRRREVGRLGGAGAGGGGGAVPHRAELPRHQDRADAGGAGRRPIAYATKDHEENPALGVRGLRLAFDNPGLLDRQLDGIALAAERTGSAPWVMAPMVATVAEAVDFAAKVRERGLKPGVMIEIPSAAILAHQLLEVVDFLSIGTNDLTQYTMAADRMATDLTHLTDPWQPAVLHLIAITAEAGKRSGKPVGVCGEAAADPVLAPALVGMGITSLSMAPAAVRAVGAGLGRVTMDACEDAAEAALAASDPQAARTALGRRRVTPGGRAGRERSGWWWSRRPPSLGLGRARQPAAARRWWPPGVELVGAARGGGFDVFPRWGSVGFDHPWLRGGGGHRRSSLSRPRSAAVAPPDVREDVAVVGAAEVDVLDDRLDQQAPAGVARLLVGAAHAEPAGGARRHRAPPALLPRALAERPARRRRESGEDVGEVLLARGEQRHHQRARPGVPQLGVLVDQPEDPGGVAVGDEERRHRQPGAGPVLAGGPQAHRGGHATAEPAQRVALAVRRRERVAVVDGHPVSLTRPRRRLPGSGRPQP